MRKKVTGIDIHQKKITVSNVMKPNSYAFSKKTSLSNTRVKKNKSPLERRIIDISKKTANTQNKSK